LAPADLALALAGCSSLLFRPGMATIRLHPTLKAHVTDHVWTFDELVEKIDRDKEQRKQRRETL
jgi:hypothetical protein